MCWATSRMPVQDTTSTSVRCSPFSGTRAAQLTCSALRRQPSGQRSALRRALLHQHHTSHQHHQSHLLPPHPRQLRQLLAALHHRGNRPRRRSRDVLYRRRQFDQQGHRGSPNHLCCRRPDHRPRTKLERGCSRRFGFAVASQLQRWQWGRDRLLLGQRGFFHQHPFQLELDSGPSRWRHPFRVCFRLGRPLADLLPFLRRPRFSRTDGHGHRLCG